MLTYLVPILGSIISAGTVIFNVVFVAKIGSSTRKSDLYKAFFASYGEYKACRDMVCYKETLRTLNAAKLSAQSELLLALCKLDTALCSQPVNFDKIQSRFDDCVLLINSQLCAKNKKDTSKRHSSKKC